MSNDPLGLFSNAPSPAGDDPLGLFGDTAPKGKTTLGEDFDIGVAGIQNTFTRAGHAMVGAALNALGKTDDADDTFRNMEETVKQRMQEANPQNKEQGIGGKAASALMTLPGQMAAMPLSPFSTGQEMIESGETVGKAAGAAMLDSAFNGIGMGLPGMAGKTLLTKAISGAGINAAQDAASRLGISAIADTKSAKEKFAPSWENTAVAAITGAGFGAGSHAYSSVKTKFVKGKQTDILNNLENSRPKPTAPENLKDLKATEGENGQMALWDSEPSRTVSKYEAVPGSKWTVDENGIPYKEDLSIDANQIQHPLQRGLFEEEMGPKTPQEADIPLTKGIDETQQSARTAESLPEADAYRAMMEKQLEVLGLNKPLEPGIELEHAKRNAELQQTVFKDAPNSSEPPKSVPNAPVGKTIRQISPGGRQTGAVNPAMFRDGLVAMRNFGEYTLKLFGRPNGPEVAMFKGDDEVGSLATSAKWKGDQQNLEADFVGIDRSHRGKGLAENAYKFLAEEGNDIRRSDTQLDDGYKMWNRFEEKGIAKNGYIPRRERGSITFEKHPLGKLFKKESAKVEDENMISKDTPVEQALAAAKQDTDGKSFKNFDSGSDLTAAKRNSNLIHFVGEWVRNAGKRADLWIRENVFPLERALRSLHIEEMKTVKTILEREFINGKRYSKDALANSGLSVKQQKAYKYFREMMDNALETTNKARAADGKKPITELEAYYSSRWDGDFRRPIYDANGDLVWYLADHTQKGLETQTKALLKEFPGLSYDPKKDHVVRTWNRKTDLQSAYSTMIDILGRDDPAVKKIQDYLEGETAGQAASMLNHEKHFKTKSGVRGYVGDRPGFDKDTETLKFFEQQIQYAKNNARWSEMQYAGQNVKKLLNDPEIRQNQPNNVEYAKDYFKNAIGWGESPIIKQIHDLVKIKTNHDLNGVEKALGSAKSYFILSKLAVNGGYTLANAVSMVQTVPHIVDLYSKGYNGDIVSAIAAGAAGGLTMGTGHIYNAMTGGGKFPNIPHADFFNKAMKYAEDNGVTARSIYDEAPVGDRFSLAGQVGHGLGKTMTIPETYFRAAVFNTFATFLKTSGKIADDMEIFRMAEDLTNRAMVDYSASERPMVFNKFGAIGNFANVLQTYGFHWYNQQSYFLREAMRGNPLPFLASMGTQALIAGAMGIPYADDLYKFYMAMKDMLPARTWKKVQENEFLSNPKLWLLAQPGGGAMLYGVLSDTSGIGLTSRLTAPSAGQMLQSPGAPVLDLGKQALSVGSAALDPTNKTKMLQAARDVAPTGLQGAIETSPMMEGTLYERRPDGTALYKRGTDMMDRKGEFSRTPKEETMRAWGLRSQREVVEREVAYHTNRARKTADAKSTSVVNSFYDAVRRGDMQDAKELMETYAYFTGKPISKQQFMNQVNEEYLSTVEKSKKGARTVQNFKDVARMERIFDELESDYQRKR